MKRKVEYIDKKTGEINTKVIDLPDYYLICKPSSRSFMVFRLLGFFDIKILKITKP